MRGPIVRWKGPPPSPPGHCLLALPQSALINKGTREQIIGSHCYNRGYRDRDVGARIIDWRGGVKKILWCGLIWRYIYLGNFPRYTFFLNFWKVEKKKLAIFKCVWVRDTFYKNSKIKKARETYFLLCIVLCYTSNHSLESLLHSQRFQ